MTPEDRIRRLRDGGRWQMASMSETADPARVAAAPTLHEVARSPRRPWVVGIATTATVLAAVAALVLVIALRPTASPGPITTPSGEPTPTVTPTSTPTPTGTPTTPAIDPALVQPPAEVPLTCDDLPGAQTITDIWATPARIGSSYVTEETPTTRAADVQDGMLGCHWTSADDSGDESTDLRIDVAVFRRDPVQQPSFDERYPTPDAGSFDFVATGVFPGTSSWMTCQSGQSYFECNAFAQLDDYWVRWYWTTTTGTSMHGEEGRIQRAFGGVVTTLAATPAPALWTPPAGAWPNLVDCDALDAALPSDSTLRTRTVTNTTGQYEDSSEDPKVVSARGGSTCAWYTKDGGNGDFFALTATSRAGGGWAILSSPSSQFSESTIDVPGADRARLLCRTVTIDAKGTEAPSCQAFAQIGVNLVSVGGGVYETVLDEEQAMQYLRDIVVAFGTVY